MKKIKEDRGNLLREISHWIGVLEKPDCDKLLYRKMVLVELLKVLNKLIKT